MVDDGSKDQTTEVIILNIFWNMLTGILLQTHFCKTFHRYKQRYVWRINSLSLSHQVALRYTRKYGADKVRVLTLVKNRGKGGAVRMVRMLVHVMCEYRYRILERSLICIDFSHIKGTLSSRGRLILMADADGATKFSDIEKVEAGLNDLKPKPV